MMLFLLAQCIRLISSIHADSQEIVLINKLNEIFNFDHNIILIESTTFIERFIKSPSSSMKFNLFVPQTLYIIAGVQEEIKLETIRKGKNTFLIIALKSTHLTNNLIFLAKVKEFQRYNINLKIGLFFSQSLPAGDLIQIFAWCWQNSIVNIFVGFLTLGSTEGHLPVLNTYTYNPFGTFNLINLTESESMSNYFPRFCYNLRKHPIRIAVHDDINSFIYEKNNTNFGGPDGKLWQTIFHLINASFSLVQFLYITDGYDIPQMVINGTIDLGPQPFKVSEKNPIYLYPIYTDIVAIIVPKALPYSEFAAYLQTLADDNAFSIALLTIPVLTIILTLFRYMKRNRILFFQSAADVVNLILNDNLGINYQNLFRIEAFVILPLTLAGFVIVNVVLSILTSYLTQPMDQPEINTFDDIEKSPFPVVVPTKKNMDQLLAVFKHTWNIDWTHKMITSSLEEFHRQTLSFNTSICFVYWGSKLKNLLEHQKRLNIRGYRIPRQTLSKSVYSYVVPVDYPLKECLNEVIHWIMNAGLYWKWTDDSYVEFVERGYFAKTKVKKQPDTEGFYIPIFIAYGWVIGVSILLIEITWKRITASCFWGRKFIRKKGLIA